MVTHFVAVLLTVYIVYTAWPGSSLFSWHPTLMALAFCFLMFEGLLVFSPHSSLIHQSSRQTKVKWHWIILTLGAVSALGGLSAIVYNKYLNDKPHFTTWHGLIGIVTFAYICLQLTGGVFVKYYQIVPRFRLADLKLYHATSGLTVFMLVCGSLILGMYSNWFTREVTGTSWYACVVCVLLMASMVMNQVTATYLPKMQNRVHQRRPPI